MDDDLLMCSVQQLVLCLLFSPQNNLHNEMFSQKVSMYIEFFWKNTCSWHRRHCIIFYFWGEGVGGVGVSITPSQLSSLESYL